MKITYQLNDLSSIAKQVIDQANTNTLLFYGEMGVGKTTLIKEIAKLLGVNDITSSPTFSLVNEYQGPNDKIFHFDFYRIEEEEEVLDIGIEDYFYDNAWCLIEWPEKIPNLIPESSTVIRLEKIDPVTRTIEIIN